MGDPTGFIKTSRKADHEAAPLERIKHWQEFKHPIDEAQRRAQGGRCMDCGTPFCHAGKTLNGMASGCPVYNLIPEWNDLIYRGRWRDALERLHQTNNFPEFTGRVCPAPCEGSCVLGVIEPPVTIKDNEYAIVERGWAEGWIVPQPPAVRSGKRVAVVGSGPAGLACAAQLNHAGHWVTVFEREDRAGGLLMYGIPNMKLDKQMVVQRRIELLVQEGIEFQLGVAISHHGHWTPERLQEEFDAVVLCCGATQGRDLEIENRDATGIHLAMDFLTANTRHQLDHRFDGSLPDLHAAGKEVVVIGGGDTGTDCVGTSIRQGCNRVTQLEIMPMPPLTRGANNPWPEWPKVYKLDYGQKEALALQGSDPRQFLVQTKRFIKDGNGMVSGLEVSRVEWAQDPLTGRPMPTEVPGSEKVIQAQLVLLALGFLGPEQAIISQFGLATDARSNVLADYGKFSTNVPGVFAAGDMRRGQSLVVWAINEGRAVARECDRYLMGATCLP